MINKNYIKNFLVNQPKARERRYKDKAIAYMLKEQFNLDIPLSKMERVVTKTLYSDRLWRKILSENPNLRGSDYDVNGSKKRLEQQAQINLGYENGYNEASKML